MKSLTEKTNGDTVLKSEKNYYKTGELKMEGDYKNNKRNGKWISYYRNGNVWAEATSQQERTRH
ncbi:MAG: hypothetical protein U5L09_09795 [Bacteroidales bacterium]|nr:hypothetical protein [Bacteroidales bacterium]